MGLDLEQVMVLLQRRYNFLREIKRLTADLQDAVSREDSVSAGLILQMRADEMENIENCQELIWRMAEEGIIDAASTAEMLKNPQARWDSLAEAEKILLEEDVAVFPTVQNGLAMLINPKVGLGGGAEDAHRLLQA